jgi:hypothetical protein
MGTKDTSAVIPIGELRGKTATEAQAIVDARREESESECPESAPCLVEHK